MNKSLTFNIDLFRHKYPVFAIGFFSNREFILSFWVIDFRISWGL